MDPLVTICCITYNHAPFIRQSLEGMLMQKTKFPIEILIHDDCSTDGTTEIVREYAAKYPDLIFPLYEEVNQYQNGKAGEIDFYNYKRARGKYIAYCEGDDYWTDPLKLQKQADFMEAHPDYSVCFHECVAFNTKTGQFYPKPCYQQSGDFDVTPDMYLNGRISVGQPVTMMFRLANYNYDWAKHNNRYCDTMEIFHLLCTGKGRFLRFCGAQYNLHEGGISSFQSDLDRSFECVEDFEQLWSYTHHPAVRTLYLNAYLWHLDLCQKNYLQFQYWRTVLYSLFHSPSLGIIILRKAITRKIKNKK